MPRHTRAKHGGGVVVVVVVDVVDVVELVDVVDVVVVVGVSLVIRNSFNCSN
jgi:hypothetical protein